MFRIVLFLVLCVGCVTAPRSEEREAALLRLQGVMKLCEDMTAAYQRGESVSNCFVEDRYIQINFMSKADYLLGRRAVSIFVQNWCQMNEQAGRSAASYSWTFKAEGVSRSERCTSLEEKLKKRGRGRKEEIRTED